ncbi:MAG TPA: cell wall hydrolase [Syntrophomonadaceae bacterium]|nr:cell wall hydrolase [Syntrophomonadaceae bacterium]
MNKLVVSLISVILLNCMILMPAQNVGAILNPSFSNVDIESNNLGFTEVDNREVEKIIEKIELAEKDIKNRDSEEFNETENLNPSKNVQVVATPALVQEKQAESNPPINLVNKTSPTNNPEDLLVVQSNGFNLSEQDLKALARLVHGEARGESFVGQVAIAAVVFNRMKSGKFGKSVLEIIFEPGAFTAIDDGQYYLEPDSSAYQAVESAIEGWDPTGGAIYYWNPHTATNKWIWSRPIINQIGKHVFAL